MTTRPPHSRPDVGQLVSDLLGGVMPSGSPMWGMVPLPGETVLSLHNGYVERLIPDDDRSTQVLAWGPLPVLAMAALMSHRKKEVPQWCVHNNSVDLILTSHRIIYRAEDEMYSLWHATVTEAYFPHESTGSLTLDWEDTYPARIKCTNIEYMSIYLSYVLHPENWYENPAIQNIIGGFNHD